MKRFMLGIALAAVLTGCTGKDEAPAGTGAEKLAAADTGAGKAFAERSCKGCHGLDGKGTAPALPHLAAQREQYLVAAIKAYREGKRPHAALKDMAGTMSDADVQNVAAYYARLPPVATVPSAEAHFSPYDSGKVLAGSCAQCHGVDGNSTTPGIPTLAGQQPRYFVIAIQEYLNGERRTPPMHATLKGLSTLDMESLALYFASQTPAQRSAPAAGDPVAGEPLSGICGGCHGRYGVSTDTATPSLAGQDVQYLIDSTRAYKGARKHKTMQRYVADIGDTDLQNIAAFYAIQKSRAAEKGQTIVQELTEKCNRCHTANGESPAMAVPKIGGQDKDYLIMALRAYRDDKRESSVMHKMSLPYSDSIIESVASFYARQPAK